VAYSPKFFKDKFEGGRMQDRFLQRWSRPAPLANRLTLAYRIVTPHSAVTSRIEALDDKVNWIPNCPAPKATEIDVFIVSAKGSRIVSWPGSKSTMKTECVGSYDLVNDESVWVVYHVIDMPNLSDAIKGKYRFYQGKTKEDLKSNHLRATLFADEPDGSRVMYDCVVRR
jgi:hypothetical protein